MGKQTNARKGAKKQAAQEAVRPGVHDAMWVKPPRPAVKEIAILSKAEVAAILQSAGLLYLPVLVAVTTGIRRGELLGLRWSDIDLKASRLTINQSLERVKGKTVFKAPKTRTSRRTITLPAITVEALRHHRATQAAEHLRLGLKPNLVSHQLMDGVHIKIVSERAGHASVSTTLAAYAAFIPNMQADAAAGVDAWLREALGGNPVAIVDVGKRG